MKRFILSGIVLIFFIMYSLYYRVMGQPAIPVVPPKNNSNPNPTATLTPTLIPGFTPTSQPAATNAPAPTDTPVPQANTPTPSPRSGYKDGTYTGDAADAFYGYIQVQAVIQNGKITNVKFLQFPNDRSRSIAINEQADPMLAQEAIQAQTANVDIISGATDSSQAFIQSLQSALNKAK